MASPEGIESITNPDITRLARKGGAKIIAENVYDFARKIMRDYVGELIRGSVASMRYSGKKTLKPADLDTALTLNHKVLLAGVGPSLDTCRSYKPTQGKSRSGQNALREIGYYQKHSDCLVVRKLPFDRLLREVSQQYEDIKQISKDFVLLSQLVTESFLVNIFKDTVLTAIHSGRQKITDNDIKLVLTIRRVPY